MKLKKISLRNVLDILTDNEMKMVTGGYNGWLSCSHDNYKGEVEETNCIFDINSALAYCDFWQAAGYNCRCSSC